MKHLGFIISIILFCNNVYSTDQIPDLLIIEGDTIYLISYPLEKLKLKHRPFDLTRRSAPNSGCWRGYQAVWKLKNGILILEKILNCSDKNERKKENIAELFRKNNLGLEFIKNEIFAHWYSAELFITKRRINPLNQDRLWLYAAQLEESNETDSFIRIKNGKVILNKYRT